jgi:hypothetical protein
VKGIWSRKIRHGDRVAYCSPEAQISPETGARASWELGIRGRVREREIDAGEPTGAAAAAERGMRVGLGRGAGWICG